ncbi:hypothetical protein I4U23_002567 [Adineta vaga]|nr:hypothetical protein I4U23_002567 [Adineta vaga]
MSICYFCLSSLLVFLLIVHCTHAASLRSYLQQTSKWFPDRRYSSLTDSDDLFTSVEPVLSRRRPFLPLNDRRRRWSNDEILIDETIVERLTAATSTTENETTGTVTDHSNDIISSNSTDFEITSNETSTTIETKHPLLRQDIAEYNETENVSTVSITKEITLTYETTNGDTSTVLSITSNEITDINTTVSANVTDSNSTELNEISESIIELFDNLTTHGTISNETEIITTTAAAAAASKTTRIPQTVLLTNYTSPTLTSELDTAIILLDYTTKYPPITSTEYNNETLNETETTTIGDYITTIRDEAMNITDVTTIIVNTTENQTTIYEQEIDNTTMIFDTTSTNITDENEYSNETTSLILETTEEPICDLSCQCTKQCPYGFDFINETCECHPPCKNYQCFGRPDCQAENGTEHDRPKRCYQPRDPGYHDTNIRYHSRWYYNPDQDACHLFVYRGLGGNENNFQTLHECRLECITCAQAPDQGECLGRLSMWYYDHKTNQCSQFDYSGCKGNDNQFFRKQNCIDTCVTRILGL